MNFHKRHRAKPQFYFDYTLLLTVIFLVIFGLIMIHSSSSYWASTHQNGDVFYYFRKQLFAVMLGFIVMFVLIWLPYRFWKQRWVTVAAAAGSMAVLLMLYIPGLRVTLNGATRWVKVGPAQFQPAEVVKLGAILVMSALIPVIGKRIAQWKFFGIALLYPAIMAVAVYLISNNLSSALIVMGIAVCMIFVASPDYKKYFIFAAIALASAVAIWFWAGYIMREDPEAGFRLARLRVWRQPELDPRGTGFQTLQSLYAIGSGGIGGKGLGESIQKLGFLPEAQNDMIFSIVCEELGLGWAVVIMAVYLTLIRRCMFIAHNAPDLFGALLVVGIMSHFAIQVILNIAVVTNTVPNTGISLPFISYGGSSVVFLLIEIGIVLSVSRGIRLQEV